MRSWWSDPLCVDERDRLLFPTLADVFALEGETVARDPLSCVLKVRAADRVFYVKRYLGNGKNLRRRWFGLRQWLVRPRVVGEWNNLLAFERWGIPTARLVAYGLERSFGGFRRGALITEEIAGAVDLARLARDAHPCLSDARWVRTVARQVAMITRTLHGHGFTHNDLKWRNLLVAEDDGPRVFLIDCPSGSFWSGPFLDYRIVKDLACLDKVAKYRLSRTQRLRFYLDYVQGDRLSGKDKRRIRKVLRFFDNRE